MAIEGWGERKNRDNKNKEYKERRESAENSALSRDVLIPWD